MKSIPITRDRLLTVAASLASEHGENPEYDRALIELVYWAFGDTTSQATVRAEIDTRRSESATEIARCAAAAAAESVTLLEKLTAPAIDRLTTDAEALVELGSPTPPILTAPGTITSITLSGVYSGYARVTVSHGTGRPESQLCVPRDIAVTLRVGDPLTVTLS